MGLLDMWNSAEGSADDIRLQGLLGGLTRMGGLLAQAGQFRPVGQPGPGMADAFLGFGEGQKAAVKNGMEMRTVQRSTAREAAWTDAASGKPTTPEGLQLFNSIPERNRTAVLAMGPEQGMKTMASIMSQRGVAAGPGQVINHNDGTQTRIPYTEQDFAFKAAGAPRTSVTNVNNIPEGVPHVGPIPPEMQLTRLPNNGGWAMQPIAGSDADVKRAKAAEAKRVEAATQGRTADVVVQDLDRALALHGKKSMLPTSGFGATTAAKVPGTVASDVNQLLDSAKSGISFNALTEMRKASPTGAALGSVQVRELEMLQAALGSLSQASSPLQFQQNLTRARNLFLDTVHGAGAGPPRIPDGISTAGPGGRGTASPPPAASPPPIPMPGQLRNGYRFRGGDPAKQESWEQVR